MSNEDNDSEEFKIPKKGDPNWTDFVVTFFKKGELVDGHPTCAGLFRVCEQVYGKILDCETDVKHCPKSDDCSATVVCHIRCVEYRNDYPESTESPGVVTMTGAAHVDNINTQEPYCFHSVSTAETKAQSRALRKIMGIDLHTHEELLERNTKVGTISGPRVIAIKALTTSLNINLNEFLITTCSVEEDALDTITQKQGDTLTELLNEYQSNPSLIPEGILER